MRRTLAVAAAGVLVVASACSSSGSGSSGSSVFRIASPIDKTGSDAAVGGFWSAGLDAAVKAVNAKGGIMGRKVVVDYKDTQSNPQTASQVTDSMLSTGDYQAVIPTSSGPMSQPILQVVNRYKILAVGTGPMLDMSNPKLYPTSFDVKYSADSQGKAVGCMAVSYHPKRVAFLHIEDPFPEAQIKSMTPELEASGATVVADESFPFAATDITPQVQKIKAAHPDLLVVLAYFNAMSTAIKGIDAIGLDNVQIVGDAEAAAAPPSSFLASSTRMPENFVAMQWAVNTRVDGQLTAGQKTAINAVSPALKGQFNAVLATYLYTYDALELIKWAAEKAKSDDSSDMVKQLESLSGTPSENTNAYIVNPPPYSSSFHGNRGKMYVVDVSGKYISGTFPEVRPIPASC